MLSYPIDEAEELLKGKLSGAKQSLENCEEDLDYLRQQITVRAPPDIHIRERVTNFIPSFRRWRLTRPGYITGKLQ